MSSVLAEMVRGMGTVEVSCPACEGDSYRPVAARNRIVVVRCRSCGTLYARSRPFADELVAIYERFPQLSNGREGQLYDDPRDGQWEANRRLGRILGYASSGRLLDLGCGRGDFLLAAERRFEVVGVDIVPRLRVEAESLSVFKGRLEQAGLADGSFDVVTAVEVLEHLFNPRETLREIRRILKPHGLLLIQTGDADSLRARLNPQTWTYLAPPIHLNVFSRKGLGRIASDLSFTRASSWSFGRAPVKMLLLANLWKAEACRPILDLAARGGLIGQMHLWRKDD